METVEKPETAPEIKEARLPGAKPKTNGEELVFYYSRERRLEKAPESVRRLYDMPEKRPNFFRTLVATRSRAMLLMTILFMCGVILLLSFITNLDSSVSLRENRITVAALGFLSEQDPVTYIAVKKTARNEKAYTGIVDLAVSVPLTDEEMESGVEAPIAVERIFFTLNPEEDFRMSVPFTAPELLIVLRAEEDQVSLRVKPE
jgi:hypothetical protein